MKTVSVYDLRTNLADYLNLVSGSEVTVVVKRFGKAIAQLVPYKAGSMTMADEEYYGFLKSGEKGEKFVNTVRRNPVEKKRIDIFREKP